ncbi:MAG: IS4 family transposase [Planctomycetota bacterium]|nr:IS4 family transposase [Planctomycetota bacterium]
MTVDQMRRSSLFKDEDVHALCDELELRFRDRDFTPATTLGLFVAQALRRGDACSTVVTQFNRERKRQGLPPVSEDGSAYCKARARLPVKLMDCLGQRVVQLQRDKTCSQWKWRSKDVSFVDGLVLRAHDTAENQEVYPQPAAQQQGLGFPQVRVVATTSLATGCIEHYNTGPVVGKRTGEVSLFREKHSAFVAGDVVVGDSNFESFHDAVLLNRVGADLVFCINGTRNSPFEGECKRIDDTIVTLPKPKFDATRFTREQWNLLPESIQYRVIRYRTSGRSEVITIVTTLSDHQRFSAEDIAELDGLRWDVETDIRNPSAHRETQTHRMTYAP